MERRKRITSEEKAVIMSKIGQGDSSIRGIAKLHGVASCTIHCWIRKRRKEQNNSFIELPIIDNEKNQRGSKKVSLQKASFEFNKFSFVIEGNIETVSLEKILKVLEVIC